MEISDFLNRLNNVTKRQKGYTARCPAHDDKNNSLSVDYDNNKILVHCHAGCNIENILGSINLEKKDLFLEKREITQEKPLTSNIKPEAELFIPMKTVKFYIKQYDMASNTIDLLHRLDLIKTTLESGYIT